MQTETLSCKYLVVYLFCYLWHDNVSCYHLTKESVKVKHLILILTLGFFLPSNFVNFSLETFRIISLIIVRILSFFLDYHGKVL